MNLLKKIISTVLILTTWQTAVVFAQQRSEVVVLFNDKRTSDTLYKGSFALVIGVRDYQTGSSWDDLSGVARDVPAVKTALEKHGFTVITLTPKPTRSEILNAIQQFIDDYGYEFENRLLVYFAGHGHTDFLADGRSFGYIVPADAPSTTNKAEFQRKAISMDTIQYYAKQISAKHALFVFDSCFSGKLVSRGDDKVPPFIEEEIKNPTRQFITAGTGTQTVPDESDFRKLFERALTGAADEDRDGYILGSELAKYLKRELTNYTDGRQTPQYGKIRDIDLDKGDFVFIVPKKVETVAVKPVPKPLPTERDFKPKTPAEKEREAWLLVQDSADAQDFRDFITAFKGGVYEARARTRLEQIVWDEVKDSKDKAKIQAYLNEFPTGENVFAAKTALRKLETSAITKTTPQLPVDDKNKSDSTTEDAPKKKAGAISKATLPNGVEMSFAYIPAGDFMMGGTQDDSEKPVHKVSIS